MYIFISINSKINFKFSFKINRLRNFKFIEVVAYYIIEVIVLTQSNKPIIRSGKFVQFKSETAICKCIFIKFECSKHLRGFFIKFFVIWIICKINNFFIMIKLNDLAFKVLVYLILAWACWISRHLCFFRALWCFIYKVAMWLKSRYIISCSL